MSTNFESAYFLCQLSHPFSKASGAGNIAFISCVTGVTYYMTGGSLYSATKAGLNQLTKNLASEWAKDKIRTNCVAPAITSTPMVEPVRTFLSKLCTFSFL
ncbi:hypothetical protein SLA2020_120130 [Shorea laevis]